MALKSLNEYYLNNKTINHIITKRKKTTVMYR